MQFRPSLCSHQLCNNREPVINAAVYVFCRVFMAEFVFLLCVGGRDSSVGIATGYRLDGPGIEARWKRDFSHMSRPALGLTQPPVQWVPGLSRGKVAEARCWPPTPSSAEVKKE
jgi:hypothetical protein